MVNNPDASPPAIPDLDTVSLQRDGHVLLIGLNRPHKRNAFDRAMLADLSRAYGVLESASQDAAEGVQSFVERRPARFVDR